MQLQGQRNLALVNALNDGNNVNDDLDENELGNGVDQVVPPPPPPLPPVGQGQPEQQPPVLPPPLVVQGPQEEQPPVGPPPLLVASEQERQLWAVLLRQDNSPNPLDLTLVQSMSNLRDLTVQGCPIQWDRESRNITNEFRRELNRFLGPPARGYVVPQFGDTTIVGIETKEDGTHYGDGKKSSDWTKKYAGNKHSFTVYDYFGPLAVQAAGRGLEGSVDWRKTVMMAMKLSQRWIPDPQNPPGPNGISLDVNYLRSKNIKQVIDRSDGNKVKWEEVEHDVAFLHHYHKLKQRLKRAHGGSLPRESQWGQKIVKLRLAVRGDAEYLAKARRFQPFPPG